MDETRQTLDTLNQDIISCRKCPRLVEWRENIARTKKRAFIDCEYWGKPVPGFGDITGRVLILGLAPGAHGSNRTGRMFTGDASGNFLYPALYSVGFANQPEAFSSVDGMKLKDVFISAVCRCAPPNNKPTKGEITNCQEYLEREIALMKNLAGIVALGKIAFDSSFGLIKREYCVKAENQPKFGHGRLYFSNCHHSYSSSPWLLTSYHPSRQNTQTGRLTPQMFQEIWEEVRRFL